jgi:hypothetical protein
MNLNLETLRECKTLFDEYNSAPERGWLFVRPGGCTGYFAHPFEDLQLRLPCLPPLLPHELDGRRNSEVLLTLQRNNLNPTRKTDVSSQDTL